MDLDQLVATIALYVLPVTLAIVLHEAAHGFVAMRLGDKTAWMVGRVTLNPLKHIDPIGTVIVPLSLLMVHSPFMFGWAKPVPVNDRNFKRPKRDMCLVAAAGPLANFAMALVWACLYRFAAEIDGSYFGEPLQYMASIGVQFNILLGVFNLLPVPPLDGGRILVGLLPSPWDAKLAGVERYSLLILVVLISIGAFNTVLAPVRLLSMQLINLLM